MIQLRKTLAIAIGACISQFTWAATPHSVDVMVVYSAQAQDQYASIGEEIQQKIADYVAFTNQAFINSKVDIQLNLVHSEAIPNATLSVDNQGISDSLASLQQSRYVRELRGRYQADLVMMLYDQNDPASATCGVTAPGVLLANKGIFSINNIDNAYGLVDVNPNCAISLSGENITEYHFAHELGHLFGLGHGLPTEQKEFVTNQAMLDALFQMLGSAGFYSSRPALPFATISTLEEAVEAQVYPLQYAFALGYGGAATRDVSTIMAYPQDHRYAPWVPYFSTPDVKACEYGITPCQESEKVAIGGNLGNGLQANNALALNLAAEQVANFCQNDQQLAGAKGTPMQFAVGAPKAGWHLDNLEIDFSDKKPGAVYSWIEGEDELSVVEVDINGELTNVLQVENAANLPTAGVNLTCDLKPGDVYRLQAKVKGLEDGAATLWLYYETLSGAKEWFEVSRQTVTASDWTTLEAAVQMPDDLTHVQAVIYGVDQAKGFMLESLEVSEDRAL
ncbi:zinc-dependent metalloprotease family protein [Hahella aquimaris]|uniref:zinc-dependent metalloprotease family protein n=1 Tax=Hahella sp. HNIBRBA332 TaxID=3015983 RepID=UPI00273AB035|nr:zinc-dependent metalloprotease family protein [Hahella sp. HNIBRBA332]WLQ16726.1 zinc-dependent metalloprotease family protein [Hahella sp. HNIBRBA332]